MPLSYSIADGIAFGMISYVVIKLASGRAKELNTATIIISILLLIKFIIH
jgi:AGZA family xanthine/uracil permease-like MFS transporter